MRLNADALRRRAFSTLDVALYRVRVSRGETISRGRWQFNGDVTVVQPLSEWFRRVDGNGIVAVS